MSDFCHWIVASETKLPWKAGDFERAYRGDREAVNESVIEACPVGQAVLQWAQRLQEPWSGRATDLLPLLIPFAGGDQALRHFGSQWPKDGRGLSVKLRRLTTNLRELGVEIITPEEGGRSGKARIFTIRTSMRPSVTSVIPMNLAETESSHDGEISTSVEVLNADRDEVDANDGGDGNSSYSDWDHDRMELDAIQSYDQGSHDAEEHT